LKIMSKLGICEIASYRGGQAFEIIGLAQDVVARCFAGIPSRVGGMDFASLGNDALAFHFEAGASAVEIPDRGTLQFRRTGEHHAFQPKVFKTLHAAVRKNDAATFDRYTDLIDGDQACTLRDLLAMVEKPIPLSEVEPVTTIAKRFLTAAMSHGALSREAHELLALAMNEFGGRSNSGEGGEDPERYSTVTNSAIKQIATGRFGVTPAYLGSAKEIEIKMAQGSKPGEGGQIPGHKVTDEIAKLRFSVPGVSLISPPPHHDIYSIEDLAQLIHDLKHSNPVARIAVKLVSIRGVGVVATGVAKAKADTIHISGHDGGTGASPLSAIKNAGMPWELGLAEAHRALLRSGLRDRVKLRVDGGLRTARDLAIATLLGADEFTFGTTPLLAAGCVMARRCHANTCPVGIATQDKALRARFRGEPEHVIAFMAFLANDLRKLLASLGLRSLSEAVGRSDLLQAKTGIDLPRGGRFDFGELLAKPVTSPPLSVGSTADMPTHKKTLDDVVWQECKTAAARSWRIERDYKITNRDRSVGTRLAGKIARATKGKGLLPGTIELQFTGVAGQSFGAFLERGMRMNLCGDAQDYVGKGMHGGEISLRLPASDQEDPMAVIAGNTLLYGATGGQFFAAGQVGERFAVRNSGALAVVEGCGDHGCEYMTGGIAVVLGQTGRNFGAGMSGGIAYVFDEDGVFAQRCNPEMVSIERPIERLDMAVLRRLIERHVELTHSRHARRILVRWNQMTPFFWKVTPAPDAVEATARVQCSEGLRHGALSRLE
ncbi:MAG: glutamate synthase-related protein, partial [Planctomycetota bacterium]|nr:glutamate synthase-related protein [Planctomycetota bacterium]